MLPHNKHRSYSGGHICLEGTLNDHTIDSKFIFCFGWIQMFSSVVVNTEDCNKLYLWGIQLLHGY